MYAPQLFHRFHFHYYGLCHDQIGTKTFFELPPAKANGNRDLAINPEAGLRHRVCKQDFIDCLQEAGPELLMDSERGVDNLPRDDVKVWRNVHTEEDDGGRNAVGSHGGTEFTEVGQGLKTLFEVQIWHRRHGRFRHRSRRVSQPLVF